MRSDGSGLMHSYHIVAELRQIRGVPGAHPLPAKPLVPLAAAPVDLNVQIADLLAERIPVEPQEISRPDLIAAGGR